MRNEKGKEGVAGKMGIHLMDTGEMAKNMVQVSKLKKMDRSIEENGSII